MTTTGALNRIGLIGTLASVLLIVGGCASTYETPSDKAYDKAVSEVGKAYEELDKVTDDVYKNQINAALRHFNKALGHFDTAFEDLAKAELPAADKPAIDALKKGDDALEKCVKALEDNDTDKAAEYYSTAQSQFDIAYSLLQ